MEFPENQGRTSPSLTKMSASDGHTSTFNAADPNFPVLLAVPHAGRVYPEEILRNLRVPADNLLRLEDRYADRLITGAIADGYSAIVAHQPRAWIDLNRSPAEIDPELVEEQYRSQLPAPSRKVRGGLGLVPRRLSGAGDLWRQKWNLSDIEGRIRDFHRPYHQQVDAMLRMMKDRFGCAILLDIHSMPPLTQDSAHGAADMVLGDRFGRSASSQISGMVTGFVEYSGYRGNLNHPYAGGYILERHGDPDARIHGLQLEIDRSLYLDRNLREPSGNLEKISDFVTDLAGMLSRHLDKRYNLIAAE